MGSSTSVSIVTPSFQQAKYLRSCVNSVLGQSYPALDYRVLDGGSTDGSVEILRSYGARVTWRSERDKGQAAAINLGLKEARGDVLGYLNSDDVLLPGAVDSAVKALARHPEVDVVYGCATVIDELGRPIRKYPVQPFDPEILVQHCFISQPAAFWRRGLHARIGYFSEEFGHTLDYEFWIRAMQAGAKMLFVDDEWAHTREHSMAKTQRLRGEILRQIRRFQIRHLGYCGRNWWEQYLRYLREERGGMWRLLPGRGEDRLYGLAWLPYVLWRRRLGGPLFRRQEDWRA